MNHDFLGRKTDHRSCRGVLIMVLTAAAFLSGCSAGNTSQKMSVEVVQAASSSEVQASAHHEAEQESHHAQRKAKTTYKVTRPAGETILEQEDTRKILEQIAGTYEYCGQDGSKSCIVIDESGSWKQEQESADLSSWHFYGPGVYEALLSDSDGADRLVRVYLPGADCTGLLASYSDAADSIHHKDYKCSAIMLDDYYNECLYAAAQ